MRMEAERNSSNLKRKAPDAVVLNDQDLIAAEILYELANTPVPLLDNNLTPLSDSHSTANTWQHVDDMETLPDEVKLLLTSLPAPPLHLMQAHKFRARFNNRTKASQRTIEASCDEIRSCFRREEAIRYLIPERGFKYTALDGQKSSVAPFRKRSDKPLSKSRGHYIFKVDRPPQITLLSLVRDAAARLPGGVGTRADICTLVRDSQYIIDEISDELMKQVVSGALDRLGTEVDPCVEHNAGLWTYLHRERGEEDFRDDGTSSAKRKSRK